MSLDERRTRHVPEAPPEPLSYRIDLFPLGDIKESIPDVAPQPASLFLELHPGSEQPSLPEISIVPAADSLLHELPLMSRGVLQEPTLPREEEDESSQSTPDGKMEDFDTERVALKRANKSFDTLGGGAVQRLLQRLNEQPKVGEQIGYRISYTNVSVKRQYTNTLLLNGTEFRERILAFAQNVAPDPEKTPFNRSPDIANKLITSATVPDTWIRKATPQVLGCLMGHVIDLTLVMDLLCSQTLRTSRVTQQRIDNVLEVYAVTHVQEVHRQIREYTDTSSFTEMLDAKSAKDKIVALIKQHRSGL
ncbi:hypothetical protein HWV62_42364 [Athelia sp. TMB]|nr:hypothetical protein HWV62_42364 [Athelia sp. TMB]